MTAIEIKAIAELYNAILAALEECREYNDLHPDSEEALWCNCEMTDDYAGVCNGIGIIHKEETFEEFRDIEKMAAQYAEICMNAGATAGGIYTVMG